MSRCCGSISIGCPEGITARGLHSEKRALSALDGDLEQGVRQPAAGVRGRSYRCAGCGSALCRADPQQLREER